MYYIYYIWRTHKISHKTCMFTAPVDYYPDMHSFCRLSAGHWLLRQLDQGAHSPGKPRGAGKRKGKRKRQARGQLRERQRGWQRSEGGEGEREQSARGRGEGEGGQQGWEDVQRGEGAGQVQEAQAPGQLDLLSPRAPPSSPGAVPQR